jgi:hypothetical protein
MTKKDVLACLKQKRPGMGILIYLVSREEAVLLRPEVSMLTETVLMGIETGGIGDHYVYINIKYITMIS